MGQRPHREPAVGRQASGPINAKAFVRHLKMASRREAVAPTVDQILALVLPAGFSADQRDNLAVALAEGLSNAAVHGNRLSLRRPVLIALHVIPGQQAVIDIRDSGPGFDVAGLGDCTQRERVLATGGRGIFLMRNLVDRLEYNACGNRVRLILAARYRPEPN